MKNFIAVLILLAFSTVSYSQTIYDSFADGDFTANPIWGGNTANFTVVPNSDVAAGAVGSNTVRLNGPAVSQTDYLSSQIAVWGTAQEWGFWIGRRAQAATNANQTFVWLYANEANLTSATVDGYRIQFGDDTAGDEIRLQYIVDGAVSATVITSTGAVTNAITDYGFLVRVTRDVVGNWALFTSTLPAATGTGDVATAIPNSTNANVAQGTGANASLIPLPNGFIGLAALHSTGAVAIIGAEFDQFYLTPLIPTSALANISGRTITTNGRGIANVVVTVENDRGELLQTTRSGSFGYYTVRGLPVGESYIITVRSKRFTFGIPSRIIMVNDNLDGVNFISDP